MLWRRDLFIGYASAFSLAARIRNEEIHIMIGISEYEEVDNSGRGERGM